MTNTTFKSLKKYFNKLKVSDSNNDLNSDNKAVKEMVVYLKNNGFKCYRVESMYLSNGFCRKGYTHIAEQKTTGKKIAFEIDKHTPRNKSVQKLINCEADYKIVFLKGSENKIDDIKLTANGIEVINLELKTDEEIIKEKELELEAFENKRISNISGLKDANERTLFDYAYKHMENAFTKYNSIIPYTWLFNKMKQDHIALTSALSDEQVSKVLKQVISDWKEIQQTQKGIAYK